LSRVDRKKPLMTTPIARTHDTIGLVIASPAASQAALTALDKSAYSRAHGVITAVSGDYSLWVFDVSSSAGASDTVLVPDDAPATGRFISLVRPGGAAGLDAAEVALTDTAGRFAGSDLEASTADLGARIALAFADTAAQTAYSATARAGGQLAIVQDDDAGAHADGSLWLYDATTTAGASDYVRVPDDTPANGRWLRLIPTLAELAAVSTGLGASLIGSDDAGEYFTTDDLESITQELGGNRPGMPMQNRIRMLGAPGPIAAGDTVTIGADVYEFLASTPPAGGTAGYIWVYQGASSAVSRANFINAVNGVIDAANITYDGAITETFLAGAGITTGDVVVISADSAGGSIVPDDTATAVSETLTTGTDIWDSATMRQGQDQGPAPAAATTITLTAADIAKGDIQAYFTFAPAHCTLMNRSRPQDEAYTITGNAVSLTLAGGVSPNNQPGDVLDVIAFG
jgi:hypothetical protein